MKFTIFSKQRKTEDGRVFTTYLTRLKKKGADDETVMPVKFREDCGAPKKCPCIIEVPNDGASANIAYEKYTDKETGEIMKRPVIWVSEWKPGEAYVDHSFDEYDV